MSHFVVQTKLHIYTATVLPNIHAQPTVHVANVSLSGVSGVRPLRLRAPAPPKLEHVPVEDVVVGEPLAVEQVPEQLPQVTETDRGS